MTGGNEGRRQKYVEGMEIERRGEKGVREVREKEYSAHGAYVLLRYV